MVLKCCPDRALVFSHAWAAAARWATPPAAVLTAEVPLDTVRAVVVGRQPHSIRWMETQVTEAPPVGWRASAATAGRNEVQGEYGQQYGAHHAAHHDARDRAAAEPAMAAAAAAFSYDRTCRRMLIHSDVISRARVGHPLVLLLQGIANTSSP